jgi:hypothetical protein
MTLLSPAQGFGPACLGKECHVGVSASDFESAHAWLHEYSSGRADKNDVVLNRLIVRLRKPDS